MKKPIKSPKQPLTNSKMVISPNKVNYGTMKGHGDVAQKKSPHEEQHNFKGSRTMPTSTRSHQHNFKPNTFSLGGANVRAKIGNNAQLAQMSQTVKNGDTNARDLQVK